VSGKRRPVLVVVLLRRERNLALHFGSVVKQLGNESNLHMECGLVHSYT